MVRKKPTSTCSSGVRWFFYLSVVFLTGFVLQYQVFVQLRDKAVHHPPSQRLLLGQAQRKLLPSPKHAELKNKCQATNAVDMVNLIPDETVRNNLLSCLGFPILVYVRTGGAGLSERVPRIEAAWAANLPPGIDVVAFHEGGGGSTKSAANSIEIFGTDACGEYASSKEETQCCKTAQMIFDARQRLQDGKGDWSWFFFVDDDAYVFLDHLQLALCAEKNGAEAGPLALGQLGCGQNNCAGFCGGAGIGISRRGLEQLVGHDDSDTFLAKFMSMCRRCGGWDDISVGMLTVQSGIVTGNLKGCAGWRMDSEKQAMQMFDSGALPLIWHYIRENMPNVQKLRDWVGSAAVLLHFSGSVVDDECVNWAMKRRAEVQASPREALSDVLDMRVGSYSMSHSTEEARCPKDSPEFANIASAENCLPTVLWSPRCDAHFFAHNPKLGKCECCSRSDLQKDGLRHRENGWAVYDIEAWTTIQAYRKPSEVLTATMGKFLSSVEDGSFLDMYSEDDGSGRQRFVFKKMGELNDVEWFNIQILGGTMRWAKFLSASKDGTSIRLKSQDTGSGRERWVVTKRGPWYHIQILDGTVNGVSLLGAAECGCKMELVAEDDGSGRQRWLIDLPPRHAEAGTTSTSTGVKTIFTEKPDLSQAKDKDHASPVPKEDRDSAIGSDCNTTDMGTLVKMLPETFHACSDVSVLVYVRTGLKSDRVSRIEAAWGAKPPKNVRIVAFHEEGPESVSEKASGIKRIATDACRSHVHNPQLLQCCKTSEMLWHSRQQLRSKETSWDWVFFVDDDAYVFLEHLQLIVCSRYDGTKARPMALGTLGCAKERCLGFCGGAGIGFSRQGIIKLVGADTSYEFLNRFIGKCRTCGLWDDISVGMLSEESKVETRSLQGTVAWRMDPELQGLRVFGPELPLVWHYIRENMPQVHALRNWAGSAPSLLFGGQHETKCWRWAHDRAEQVGKSPRDALSKILDLSVGSYKATLLEAGHSCKVQTLNGAPASLGNVVESPNACMAHVLATPACSSGAFLHGGDSGPNARLCSCCMPSPLLGVDTFTPESGRGWSLYRVEAWTTIRAYRPPEQIATWKMGTYLSTIPDGSNLDMFFDDDASGRQRFILKKGDGDWYNIIIGGGTDPFARYLTTSEDGRSVRLVAKDTESGRERWVIRKTGAWFTIRVLQGTSPGVSYLSMARCGCRTEVVPKDEGSVLQRWVLDLPPVPENG